MQFNSNSFFIFFTAKICITLNENKVTQTVTTEKKTNIIKSNTYESCNPYEQNLCQFELMIAYLCELNIY